MKRFLIVLTMLLAFPLAASAATLTVCSSGCPYVTITEAVAAANNGDIVSVGPGDYTDNVLVNKSITIRGQMGANDTSVTAADPNTAVFAVLAPDVTISGFTVSGADGNLNAAGVLVGGAFPGDPAYVGLVSDVTVSKCIVEHNGQGIYVWGANSTTIVNNTVRYNSSVPGNVDAGTGIIVWAENGPPALNTSIVNNEVYGNDKFGIFVGASAATDFGGTRINGNNLYENGAYLWLGYPAPGANWLGMGFMNANGTIKVSGNKILDTNPGGPGPVWVWATPGLKLTGNPVRSDLGPNIPMPTP